MFDFLGRQRKRSRLANSARHGPLKDYLKHPPPLSSDLISAANLLAVDFETTGLDAKNDEILSIGFVQIRNLEIDLSTARHILIRQDKALPQDNVIIHKITDDQINSGVSLDQALSKLLKALCGQVLIAHHAHIESHFLNQACMRLYGSRIMLPVVDTLAIEAKKLPAEQHVQNNLNLNVCCKRYNLPRYRLHDALSDALSCGELFLAQMTYANEDHMRLKQVMHYLP